MELDPEEAARIVNVNLTGSFNFARAAVPLLRQGTSQKVKSSCADVAEVFTDCPDLVRFYGGTP